MTQYEFWVEVSAAFSTVLFFAVYMWIFFRVNRKGTQEAYRHNSEIPLLYEDRPLSE